MMITDEEMRGLLGHVYEETTEEQRALIERAADVIDARWPITAEQDGTRVDDYADERRLAMNAALALVLGDSTDEEFAADWRRARAAEHAAHASLTGAIIAGDLLNPAESEVSRADRLGVTRVTLRKALAR